MNHLHLRRYIIVGHSMGGYTALAFADLFPKNVAGICLFHSTSLPDSEEKKISRNRAIEAVKNDHKQFVNSFFEKLFAPENVTNHKNEIEQLKTNAIKITKQGIVNALEGMKERVGRETVLKKSEFPILFIVGKKDNVIPWESMKEQIDWCKKPSTLWLDKSGHMGFYEEKEKTLKVISKFCRAAFREKIS